MKRLNRDGLPVDAREWTAADWQDLHEAIEGVKRKVKARHAARTLPTSASEERPPMHGSRLAHDQGG